MTDSLRLDDVTLPGIDDGDRDLTSSVRYHGPPGTGKTSTAAAHVARLLQETDYTIADVCWVTYRKSLAHDTLERLEEWGVISEDELDEPTKGRTRYIGTVHAVGSRSVGGVGNVADWKRQKEFCHRHNIDTYPPDQYSESDMKLLFDSFGWLVSNCLDPSDPDDVARAEGTAVEETRQRGRLSIPSLWERWQSFKREEQLHDFAEQLQRPIEEDEPVPCPIFVADEYHDAYPLMADLCEKWIDEADIAIVCGDPDQVVNHYEGASPEFFESIDLPNQLLDESYRVPSEHWALAGEWIDMAPNHTAPNVTTHPGGMLKYWSSPGPFNRHGDNNGDVGDWDVPDVKDGHPGAIGIDFGYGANDPNGPGFGKDPDSVLILARTKNQVRGICAALDDVGMLYKSQRSISDWITTDKRGFDVDPTPVRRRLFDALVAIEDFSPDAVDEYTETLGHYMDTDGNSAKTRFALVPSTAAALLDHTASKYHKLPRAAGQGQTMNDLCDDLRERGVSDVVTEEEFCQYVERDFWDVYTSTWRSVDDLVKVTAARDRIALRNALHRHAGTGTIVEDDIGVEVMTIHASKGHEASDVIVYPGITKSTVTAMRGDVAETANEYRTWYVACSRASERLHIVRDGFPWTTSLPRTPFGTTTHATN